jgi:superfamily II DNA/RNA helicase
MFFRPSASPPQTLRCSHVSFYMTDTFDVTGEFAPVENESMALPQAEATAEAALPNGFVELGLAPELVQAVADLGYTQPTGVQLRAIPLALPSDDPEHHGYNDLMVSSQTGSGKTAAFLLPVLHTLIRQQAEAATQEREEYERACAEAAAKGEPAPKRNKRKDPTNPRNFKAAVPGALVVCPTRELAQQVAHDAIELVKHCRGMRIANVVGGMPYPVQIAKLQNANLVVATPGRLLDLQRSMQIKLDEVQFLVVDEADRMLDLGFSDDLAEINQLTAQRRQTMMFSATFAPRIQQLAMRVMHDNGSSVKRVQVDSPQEKHANIKQVLFWADNMQHKRALLDHWLRDTTINQAIVFASTQIECDGLATELQQAGFVAVALHGALSQGLRTRRLMALRSGQVQILVATDVAARGIDVPTITHVFNFGLPMKAEDYTHRIGRTGRAGRDGIAVTFAEFRDRSRIFDIEGYTKQPFKAETVPGLEPRQRAPEARPQRNYGNGGGQGRFNRGGEGRGNGGRFEDRGPARGAGRFEGRPQGHFEGRPQGHFEGRPEGRPEGGHGGRDGGRFEGRPEGRFEGRGNNAGARSFDRKPGGNFFGDDRKSSGGNAGGFGGGQARGFGDRQSRPRGAQAAQGYAGQGRPAQGHGGQSYKDKAPRRSTNSR